MAKTLAELGEDWVSFGVSIVESPAVEKAKWIAVKGQHRGETSMGNAYVRERRAELGLTQEQVAVKSGVDRSRIAQIETGARGLNADMATKIGPALGMKPGALMARQIAAQGATAYKSGSANKGSVHRLLGDLEDYRAALEDDEEKAAFDKAIAELSELLKDDSKPAGEDRSEKSRQSVPRDRTRDAHGRRRRDEDRADVGRDTATKSSDQRQRDALGRRR